MHLILQRRPGTGSTWLGGRPFPMNGPEGASLLGLHLPEATPSTLVARTEAGDVRCEAPAAGWVLLPLPGRLLALHAEGAPFRVSGAPPACRFWDAAAGLIPEAHWRAARFLGDGAVLALAGGPARPFLRLGAGETGRITMPPLALPGPVEPILVALRGPLPVAELSAPLTLTLRAAAACEVLWEGLQLRPNSFANSA